MTGKFSVPITEKVGLGWPLLDQAPGRCGITCPPAVLQPTHATHAMSGVVAAHALTHSLSRNRAQPQHVRPHPRATTSSASRAPASGPTPASDSRRMVGATRAAAGHAPRLAGPPCHKTNSSTLRRTPAAHAACRQRLASMLVRPLAACSTLRTRLAQPTSDVNPARLRCAPAPQRAWVLTLWASRATGAPASPALTTSSSCPSPTEAARTLSGSTSPTSSSAARRTRLRPRGRPPTRSLLVGCAPCGRAGVQGFLAGYD